MIGRVFVVNDVLPTTPLLGYTPGRTTIDSSSVWGRGFGVGSQVVFGL